MSLNGKVFGAHYLGNSWRYELVYSAASAENQYQMITCPMTLCDPKVKAPVYTSPHFCYQFAKYEVTTATYQNKIEILKPNIT